MTSTCKTKFHPESYMPISILSPISKIVERSIQLQLSEYIEVNSLWNLTNHAYRQGYSTSTDMAQLADSIFEGCDNNQVSVLMATDQSFAFDCVQYKILIKKLGLYKFSASTIKWITSYLTYRSYYVQIGISQSQIEPMSTGVPQGSVLGPLFYTLFFNELPESIKKNMSEHCTSGPKHIIWRTKLQWLWKHNQLCRRCNISLLLQQQRTKSVHPNQQTWGHHFIPAVKHAKYQPYKKLHLRNYVETEKGPN